MRLTIVHVAVAALLVCAAGCASEPLRATTIQVGTSLNSDNSVGRITTTFKRGETIYVSVLTAGRSAGTIMARWTYKSIGSVLGESEKKVSYNDDAATEFHIENSGGFRPGEYEVEILVDGKSFATRRFRVE